MKLRISMYPSTSLFVVSEKPGEPCHAVHESERHMELRFQIVEIKKKVSQNCESTATSEPSLITVCFNG